MSDRWFGFCEQFACFFVQDCWPHFFPARSTITQSVQKEIQWKAESSACLTFGWAFQWHVKAEISGPKVEQFTQKSHLGQKQLPHGGALQNHKSCDFLMFPTNHMICGHLYASQANDEWTGWHAPPFNFFGLLTILMLGKP